MHVYTAKRDFWVNWDQVNESPTKSWINILEDRILYGSKHADRQQKRRCLKEGCPLGRGLIRPVISGRAGIGEQLRVLSCRGILTLTSGATWWLRQNSDRNGAHSKPSWLTSQRKGILGFGVAVARPTAVWHAMWDYGHKQTCLFVPEAHIPKLPPAGMSRQLHRQTGSA